MFPTSDPEWSAKLPERASASVEGRASRLGAAELAHGLVELLGLLEVR